MTQVSLKVYLETDMSVLFTNRRTALSTKYTRHLINARSKASSIIVAKIKKCKNLLVAFDVRRTQSLSCAGGKNLDFVVDPNRRHLGFISH